MSKLDGGGVVLTARPLTSRRLEDLKVPHLEMVSLFGGVSTEKGLHRTCSIELKASEYDKIVDLLKLVDKNLIGRPGAGEIEVELHRWGHLERCRLTLTARLSGLDEGYKVSVVTTLFDVATALNDKLLVDHRAKENADLARL